MALKKLKLYFKNLATYAGIKYLLFQVIIFCFISGFIQKSLSLVMYPYFTKILNLDAKQTQYFFIIVWSPWNLQTLIAMLSDLYPLLHYRKRYYMLITSVVGSTALILLSFISFVNWVNFVPILLFFVVCTVVFDQVLTETQIIEFVNKNISIKRSMFTWITINRLIGSLAGNYVGVFVENHSPKKVLWIAIPFMLSIIVPILLGFLPELRIEITFIDRDKLRKKRNLYIISCAMCVFSIIIDAIALVKNVYAMLASIVIGPACLFVACFLMVDKELAKICVYSFLHNGLFVKTRSARDAWFTAEKACLENGPAFSFSFYYTYSQFAGNISAIAGAVIYQKLFKKVTVEKLFLVSTVLRLLGFIPEFILQYRVAEKYPAVEKLLYVVGNEVLYGMAYSFQHIGILLLIAYREGDAMLCAFVFGFNSLGYAFAKSIGSLFIDFLAIKTKMPCNFELYWLARLIGMGILPSLSLLGLCFLVPKILPSSE